MKITREYLSEQNAYDAATAAAAAATAAAVKNLVRILAAEAFVILKELEPHFCPILRSHSPTRGKRSDARCSQGQAPRSGVPEWKEIMRPSSGSAGSGDPARLVLF